MCFYSNPDVLIELEPTLIAIGVGSVATYIIQHAIQQSSQKRQLFLDIAKHKFQTIQKASGGYVSMTKALSRFHELSLISNESKEEKFYAMCNYFKAYSEVPGFELDSLDGEDVISRLSGDIFKFFDPLGDEVISSMIGLVETEKDEKQIRFNKFKMKIPTPLFDDFCKKIIENPHDSKVLAEYCGWLREVILFEINTAYSLWYGENPKFDLNEKLKRYLEENNFKPYVKRLEVTKKSKIKREFYKFKRWLSN